MSRLCVYGSGRLSKLRASKGLVDIGLTLTGVLHICALG